MLNDTELMLIWNSDVDGAGICVGIVLLIVYLSNSFFWFIWGGACFAYGRPHKFFQGGKSRNFAYLFQFFGDGTQVDVNKKRLMLRQQLHTLFAL